MIIKISFICYTCCIKELRRSDVINRMKRMAGGLSLFLSGIRTLVCIANVPKIVLASHLEHMKNSFPKRDKRHFRIF